MKILRIPFLFFTFFFQLSHLSAQVDTLPTSQLSTKGLGAGISQQELIDELMPFMPGLGSNSREMLTEQSVKPY